MKEEGSTKVVADIKEEVNKDLELLARKLDKTISETISIILEENVKNKLTEIINEEEASFINQAMKIPQVYDTVITIVQERYPKFGKFSFIERDKAIFEVFKELYPDFNKKVTEVL